jgi:hypothetical protein
MEDLLLGIDVSDDKRLKYIKSLPLCDINIFKQLHNMSKRGGFDIECYSYQYTISKLILKDNAKRAIIKHSYLDSWGRFIDTHLTIPTHKYEDSYDAGVDIYLLGIISKEYREANLKVANTLIARLIVAEHKSRGDNYI